MRLRYLLIVILFIIFSSCSKNGKEGNPSGGGNGSDTTKQQDTVPKQEISIEEALFIDPAKVRTKTSDTHIMDTLIQYLDHTPKGAVVHINIYLFNYQPLLTAVKRAYFRGVEMHVMIDNSRSTSIDYNRETIPQLQAVFDSPSEVVVVESDVASNSIDHHKHVLFSEIDLPQGIAKNVVFSTSHNFTDAATKKVQDAVIFTNKELYDAFLSNWNAMVPMAQSGMKQFSYKVYDLDSIKVFFFPERKNGVWNGEDAVIDILNKISDFSTATVRVGMSDWSIGRLNVAQKLTELQQEGVTVEVIAKDQAAPAVLQELVTLENAGGYVKILQTSKENIHSKFTIIKGMWNGKKQKIVLCGTHNFTDYALKYNNEVILMLKNSALFDDYYDYFDELKKTL